MERGGTQAGSGSLGERLCHNARRRSLLLEEASMTETQEKARGPGRHAPRLSIVIPAYNERERLPATLESLAKYLRASGHDGEVVLVDDGSRDDTADLARAEAERLGLSLRALTHTPNRGKGYAARRGMLAARGDRILLCDADESVPIAMVDRFLERLEEGPAAVIGSRLKAGSKIVIQQPALRERLGEAFRELGRLLVPGISDFTCGFKLFRRDAAQRVFGLQRLWGWGYDVEILLIARRLGLEVTEEPVEWSDDARTRVRLGVDVFRSAWDLVRIGWNDLRGCYASPSSERVGAGDPTSAAGRPRPG